MGQSPVSPLVGIVANNNCHISLKFKASLSVTDFDALFMLH